MLGWIILFGKVVWLVISAAVGIGVLMMFLVGALAKRRTRELHGG